MGAKLLKISKYLVFIFTTIALSSCSLRQSVGDACLDHHRSSWDYSEKKGPRKWSELSKEFEICTSGTHQSPINIDPNEITLRNDYALRYHKTKIDIIDNEHTIEFDYEPGSFLYIDGEYFELEQFHFHSPSEHEIKGHRSDMEIHLVHKNTAGKLAVLSVLVNAGKNNKTIAQIWKHLPHDKDKHHIYPKEKINIAAILPANLIAYYYSGSLTTPPCSESVHWLILKEDIEFSRAELDYFHTFYNWNIRGIQK